MPGAESFTGPDHAARPEYPEELDLHKRRSNGQASTWRGAPVSVRKKDWARYRPSYSLFCWRRLSSLEVDSG